MILNLSNHIDIKKFETYSKKLLEKQVRIELREIQPSRTLNQNKYFHVCCQILGDYAGYTVDEMKIIIKDQLDWMRYEKNGHMFYRSVSDLNKEEFTNLIDYTRSFGDQNGIYIPTSDEFIKYQFDLLANKM